MIGSSLLPCRKVLYLNPIITKSSLTKVTLTQQNEADEKFMVEYDKWWAKWHRTLIAGAVVGILIDLVGLYVLLTSELTSSFFFRSIIAVVIGVLIGFSAILFFAFNPKLRIKYVRYAIRRKS